MVTNKVTAFSQATQFMQEIFVFALTSAHLMRTTRTTTCITRGVSYLCVALARAASQLLASQLASQIELVVARLSSTLASQLASNSYCSYSKIAATTCTIRVAWSRERVDQRAIVASYSSSYTSSRVSTVVAPMQKKNSRSRQLPVQLASSLAGSSSYSQYVATRSSRQLALYQLAISSSDRYLLYSSTRVLEQSSYHGSSAVHSTQFDSIPSLV